MRVTNNMISNQVVYNLGRSLDRFMHLQVQMSTGRRINTPSDDPIGTQQDLRYRTEIAGIAQYKENTNSGLSQLARYDSILGSMKDTLSQAYELAVSLANDTYDENSRSSAASEALSLFEQMLGLANTQNEARYIFSGYKISIKPFISGINGIEYAGDTGRIQAEIEAATRVGINLIGSEVLMGQMSVLGGEADLQAGISAATLLADLNLAGGVDLTSGTMPGHFTVTDNNTGTSIDIDVSAALTIDDVITAVNGALAAGGIDNLTLGYGLEGDNLRWDSSQNGLISGATKLSNLNDGAGVDRSTGKIRVHTVDETISFEIDITSAETIDDVIQAMNNTFSTHPDPAVNNVIAAINPTGTGIDIVDGNGIPLGLQISEASGDGSTAKDLGILGAIDPILNGEDLNPRTDFAVTEADPDQTTATDLGILGDFHGAMTGESLRPALTEATSLTLLNHGHGMTLGQIRISLGQDTVYLDLGNTAYSTVGDIIAAINSVGLDINASINDAQTGLQIVPTVTNKSLIVDEVQEGRTAHAMGIFGSPDIFGSMLILEQALRNNDQEVIAQIIGNLDDGMRELLNHRASVGSKVIRLETAQSRLNDLDYAYTKLLSEVEDADLTKLVTDLAMQEASYQAAMISSAKIIQPTLLHFLK
ncbi:MAG: flagellar hook-associated protein FlgL [Candidatus Zixiibacteriota bacterium]|nr:MAG: flagellar hook-associated protein FlgL [candidate division Zixibacteria bacterium]